MLERAFQGAPSFEILNPQASNPTALWKVAGGVQKVYDKMLKGTVYQLVANGSQTMMQLPKEDKVKQGLGLVQPILVFQVFLPQNREKPFSLEIGVTDGSRTRRRLVFSASSHESQANPSQARFSLTSVRRSTWLNLCIDVDSLLRSTYGQVMKSVDSVVVHAECRLRRVFTMRSPPPQSELTDDSADANAECEATGELATERSPGGGAPSSAGSSIGKASESIPRSYEFPAGVDQHTQVIGAADQTSACTDELQRCKEDRLCSADPSDVAGGAHELQPQDGGRQADDEAEDGVTTACWPPSARERERRGSLGRERLAGALAPLATVNDTAEPVGYEEMVRRASESREDRDAGHRRLSQQQRAAANGGAAVAEGGESREDRDGCTLPEAMGLARTAAPRRVVAAEKVSKSGPLPKSAETRPNLDRSSTGGAAKANTTAPQISQAGCLATATVRRPKSQRQPGALSGVQARNASDPGSRRFPTSARGRDRSPSGNKRQARPLPLEIGGARGHTREDGGSAGSAGIGSAPSSGGGAAPSSARRLRRQGRLPAAQTKPGDDESVSPSSNATKRRRDQAMKTLHKTAEIYGVPKQHASLGSKSADRGSDESRASPGTAPRADEEDTDPFACVSPTQLPEVMRSMRYYMAQHGEVQSQTRDFLDDVGEPPPLAPLEVGTSHTDVSAVLQAAIDLSCKEASSLPPATLPATQEKRRRPQVLEAETTRSHQAALLEGMSAECSPTSSASVLSPSRVLAAQAEANDEIIFDEVQAAEAEANDEIIFDEGPSTILAGEPPILPPAPLFPMASPPVTSPTPSAEPSTASNGTWSAFGATVRHNQGCWPPLSARFQGAGDHGGYFGGSITEPSRGCADSEASAAGSSAAELGPAEAAAGSRYEPPERVTNGGACGSTAKAATGNRQFATDRGVSAAEALASLCGVGDDSDSHFSRENLRRIKSLSPPRRWRRPQPFGSLERQAGEAPAAPSSAPSEHDRGQPPLAISQAVLSGPAPASPAPFTYQNEPSAPPPPRSAGLARGVRPPPLEDEARSRALKPALEVPPLDVPHRPFTPPVVPVGKLLRGVYDSARAAAAASAATSAASAFTQGPDLFLDAESASAAHTRESSAPKIASAVAPSEAADGLTAKGEEGSILEAVYDPALDLYYDPRNNKYYERRRADMPEALNKFRA